MLLLEQPYLSKINILIPTSSGKIVQIDEIDPRFEDMMADGVLSRKTNIFSWLAKLPNGNEYLTFDGVVDGLIAQALLDKGYTVLPDNWWEYALGLHHNKVVKAPKKLRPGEQPQEELDAAGTKLESRINARLSRIVG